MRYNGISAPLPAAAGVICEFNPFHNGHKRLLSAMREAVGEDGCVVCVMSGLFVQRGTPAVADPYVRAAAALAGGADLVVGLPFPWSAGSAEAFAAAGVGILDRMGVGTLAFGSECADTALLAEAAAVIGTPDFVSDCAARVTGGAGAAAAWAEALRARLRAPLPDGFPGANDRLAVNYLAALSRQGGGMRPLTVRRAGQAYRDDVLTDASAPSASALRVLLREAACVPGALSAMLDGTMPDAALRVLLEAVRDGGAPCREDALLPLFHGLFRLGDADVFDRIAELSGGLARRMVRAALDTGTPDAFWDALHSRLYTDARLRRGMLYAAAGVGPDDLRADPAYVVLYGADARGCAYLKALDKARRADPDGGIVSVVTKPADAPACRQTELARRAEALFTLCRPTPCEAGALMKKTPVILL